MPTETDKLNELQAFLAGEFETAPVPEADMPAGALAAGAIKVPVKTFFGNIRAAATNLPYFGLSNFADGTVLESWNTGTGFRSVGGDLTIGSTSRSSQSKHGTTLGTVLNDDVRNLAVIGRDWREIQLLNHTTAPTDSLDIVPARDTHRIFIYKDTNSVACLINLASTGLVAGMKFMFVNLSAAETAGTNEQQTVTISATGGTFTISYGGQTTTALAYNAAGSVVQAALEALSSIGTGNIAVSLGGSVYTLTFQNALGNTNVAAVTTNASLLTGGAGTATVATTVPGVAAIGQLVVVSNGAGIAGNSINRLTLSRGAVLVLQAVPPALVGTVGYRYIITQSLGTIV